MIIKYTAEVEATAEEIEAIYLMLPKVFREFVRLMEEISND